MTAKLDIDAVRSGLPITQRLAYLNTGTAGPLPAPTVDAMIEAARTEAEKGRIDHQGFQHLFDRLTDLRAGLAAFVGAEPGEIAISHNTTDGMNIGIWSLPWQPGDRVVTTTLEHPGALLPLYLLHRRFGVDVTFAEIGRGGRAETLEAMARAIRPGTKLVMLSHVTWGTGAVLPLREIVELAHAAGALVLVDGAQSVGSIPVDMHADGADFYAFSGQKWLCGPEGTGGIFVRADRMDRFTPAFIGPFGIKHDETYRPNDAAAFEFAPGAQRFEVGSVYRPGIYGLRASVEWRKRARRGHLRRHRRACRVLLGAGRRTTRRGGVDPEPGAALGAGRLPRPGSRRRQGGRGNGGRWRRNPLHTRQRGPSPLLRLLQHPRGGRPRPGPG